ncbi:glutathione S-transferase [Mesobaculum littorinae]|uniref:Glutathione S-transferase n=1 Tax=Mesobaculum littorinae TaxID=2486419 RepID=A0A438ADG0_9RHOB|nr:glutathione S-transferase [Mesobaculum littorinae]RVV96736.1 glutathione S-transferase [Mesobaculum littorinae]
MTYDLFIADRLYSSWSLRGWLIFDSFGLPVTTHVAGLYSGSFAQDLAPVAPARTVPAMRTPEGLVVGDSLAIAETLAERHPDIPLWPADPADRARARWLVAEMHSGFSALRRDCPMRLGYAVRDFAPTQAVRDDVARIEALWAFATETRGTEGPWLFGAWSLADIFYAPVATRIATYGLPVGPAAAAYVAAHLAHPALRRWRGMGLAAEGPEPPAYRLDLPRAPWPGPAPLPAEAVIDGTAENSSCPYSGRPVTHFLRFDTRVWGFCNAFCRDKTAADPAAWPAFLEMVDTEARR